MNGINSGILTNAHPLTAEQIAKLEKKAAETGEAYVYLNEQGKICFTTTFDPDIIKELAWHETNEIITKTNSATITKKVYAKQGLESVALTEIFKKDSIDSATWAPTADTLNPGLYQPGTIELFKELGSYAVKDRLISSWKELTNNHTFAVNDGVLSKGISLTENLTLNEYGFCYDTAYTYGSSRISFAVDGSITLYDNLYDDTVLKVLPSGTAIYSQGTIDLTSIDFGIWEIAANGALISCADIDEIFYLGEPGPAFSGGDLVLPDDANITTISNNLFEESLLTAIVLPKGLKSISNDTFNSCMSLTSIDIPASVAEIGTRAFYSCKSLTMVTFEENSQLTSIMANAFEYCTSLTSIEIPASVTTIRDKAFSNCESLTSITIPEGVTSLSYCILEYCKNLTEVVLPASLTLVGSYVFKGCYALTSVTFNGTMAQWEAVLGARHVTDSVSYVQCTDGQISA
jgi:hypothetical protein